MAKERMTFSSRRFLVGKAGPFPRLVFREEVMLNLDQFSHFHVQGEHGGFLIGRKRELKSAEGYEVIVERFVPIPQRDDAARLVITSEQYNMVERALRTGAQGELIVGWAHTHPGFGVFLSNFDKEQHERFFPEEWQIAYVMDNQAQERTAYHLTEGEWNRLTGYYVLRQMAENEMGVTSERPSPWLKVVLALLVVFFVIVGGTYGYSLVQKLRMPSETQVIEPALEPQPVVTVQKAEIQVPAVTTITPPTTVPLYGEYVVQKGDNLWLIAKKLWGDSSLFQILVKENDIKDTSAISVGKILRYPKDPKR